MKIIISFIRTLISKNPFLKCLIKPIWRLSHDLWFYLHPSIQIFGVYEYCSKYLLGKTLHIVDPEDICDAVFHKAYLDEKPCKQMVSTVHVYLIYIAKFNNVRVIGHSDFMVVGNK